MQSLVVDTNSVIKKLEQRGFSRAQAEGITEALKELDASSLPTKADLAGLEARLYKFMLTAMAAQTALIVALIEILK